MSEVTKKRTMFGKKSDSPKQSEENVSSRTNERKIIRKTSGLRNDKTEWYGVVLEEKMHISNGVAKFYPQKMQFINSRAIFDVLEEGQSMQIEE